MKTAKEYWKEKFGEYPQSGADKLAVAMMQEYAIEQQVKLLATPAVVKQSEQLCRTFFPDGKTTSATKCRFCGKEKWEH